VSAHGKRSRANLERVDAERAYPVAEAFALLKACTPAKFDESVDVSIRLGVDPRKTDQIVRGSSDLPHGTGRKLRVAVFADGAPAQEAQEAGADVVGLDDLAERVKQGWLEFDYVIATPAAMPLVGSLGQILGPRGLMPNPKIGSVTAQVADAVRRAKAGQVRYRSDKQSGSVRCSIGRISFEPSALQENLEVLIGDLNRLKPEAAKGTYLRKIVVSSTMGPGVVIDQASLA